MDQDELGIIDYGMGNLKSVYNAFCQIGAKPVICTKPEELQKVKRIVLPGVGSFAKAIENIRKLKWDSQIKDSVERGKPLLGICLGMQLLYSYGEEHGLTTGLDIIKGTVTQLIVPSTLRVPHVGWNSITICNQHPVLEGVKKGVDFYFVHSFHCVTESAQNVVATANYGMDFTAIAAEGSAIGIQFHPEKSQPSGLRILENFAFWDGTC